MKILVVDDEKLLVKGMKFNLENEGYEVMTAYDGAAAVELEKKENFDLIVMDVMMPGLSGSDACMKIREFSDVPVIMLTARSEDSDKLMEDFHSSISFDQKLYYWDIQGSIAHATMLGNVGVITKEEAATLVAGLREILADIEAGKVQFNPADEDIHMNMEVLLTEKVGDVGKKLHTGRSRNDQVAVDMRMYLRHEVMTIQAQLLEFLETLLAIAKKHLETAMPGYTHLQRAQPITLGHHIMAYFEMFKRDYQRLDSWLARNNIMPLGSGALAGTTFPLDRNETAEALHFDGPCLNSLDGVSDRDFALEFLSDASISMMHLSRFCEEVILWASQEFAFIDLDDAYSTGSSIMPQKKNPDVAELVRGKTGRVYGALMGLLTTMKGLPLAYNKDMQEDKEGVFDAVDTWKKCLLIFEKMLATATFKEQNMRRAAAGGFTNATDFADYLVTKGVPFRDAHAVVGEAVAYCIMNSKALDDCTMDEFKSFSPLIDEDIYDKISIDTCIHKRQTIGAPGPDQVQAAIDANQIWLDGAKATHEAQAEKLAF